MTDLLSMTLAGDHCVVPCIEEDEDYAEILFAIRKQGYWQSGDMLVLEVYSK